MFGMKTSDLFKRAKQLADLEGSDFISWNEAINLINESNIGLYQKLIGMGDNSFVKSYHIKDYHEKLPEDFWQLKGVYLYNNGNLQTINRRADNSGIHHLSYELRNGFLNLFGYPADVLVEYYLKPEKLMFKPNVAKISLENKEYLDCHKHTFLYKDSDVSENDTLSIYDIDGVKTVKDFIQITHSEIEKALITDYYVLIQKSSSLVIYDMTSGYSAEITSHYPIITENGNVYLIDVEGVIKSFIVGNGTIETRTIKTDVSLIDGSLFVCDDNFSDFFYLDSESGNIIHNGTDTYVRADKIIYHKGKCYYLGYRYGVIDSEDSETVLDSVIGLPIGFIGIDENTGFGYCSKKFNEFCINPYCEDTPLDYPNSFFFQIISYLLAIAFKSKQGADISLLSTQLATIEETFMETLGSDDFQFTRMGNVYN